MAQETIPAPFDPKYVAFIRRILSVAETGEPTWNPAEVYVYPDGNNGRKQCTLSIGFTADGGNLRKVLERYVQVGGVYGPELAPYIAALKGGSSGTDPEEIALLKEIGNKDPLMMKAQEQMFDKLYLGPAFTWAAEHGFAMPLSYLVIADSFLHSGSMLGFLIQRFPEKKPSDGGNERIWIHQYTNTRRDWLAQHSTKVLRNTVYRCDCYLREMNRANWDLAQAPINMHGTEIHYA
jgi:chitosanase